MRLFRMLLALSFSCCLSHEALANAYGIITLGYADVDLGEVADKSASYGGALGYQVHPQWYVEAGYLHLVDSSEESQDVSASGPYLAFLGKAGSQEGELFYRLGIASIDKVEKYLPSQQACADATQVLRCEVDERILAGMAGLGFDYFVGLRAMVRVEYMYMGGKDDFSSHAINLGFRYNF